MKNYNIMITGHGGELVYGNITGTQYDYWKDRTDEMEDHLIDPEFDDEVSDEDDPRYLGEWSELDDIEHIAANNAYSCYVYITDENSNDIVDQDIEDFIKENNCKVSEKKFDLKKHIQEDGIHYVFQGMSNEKGCFHVAAIELPDKEELDLSKIEFTTTNYPNGEVLIEDWFYNGKSLGNESDGGADVKGHDFEILKCKREGNSFQIEDG